MNKVTKLPTATKEMMETRDPSLPTYEVTNNNCYVCFQIERACDEHADLKEAEQTTRAQALVDDNELQYKSVSTWLQDEPSGHDWIAPEVRMPDKSIRREFLEPTTNLADRLFAEFDELRKDERVCDVCHYVCLSAVVCPNCN